MPIASTLFTPRPTPDPTAYPPFRAIEPAPGGLPTDLTSTFPISREAMAELIEAFRLKVSAATAEAARQQPNPYGSGGGSGGGQPVVTTPQPGGTLVDMDRVG